MSSIIEVNVGGYKYSFDEMQLRQELQSKDISSEKIEQILSEIKQGDMMSLKDLGLEHLVTVTKLTLDEPGDYDFESVLKSLENLNAFNIMDALLALHEAAIQMKKSGREMRHAARDSAVDSAMNAADKIRSAALLNLIFGCVSGAVNIGMGLFGAVSATKQLSTMKSPGAEFKAAKMELKQNKNDIKMADKQSQLKQTQDQIKTDKTKIETLETQRKLDMENRQKVEVEIEQLKKSQPVDTAKLEAKQKDLAAFDNKIKKTEVELSEARESLKTNQAKETTLKTEIQKLADDSKKTNDSQLKKVERDIKKLESKQKETTDPVESKKLENQINDLKNRRTELQSRQEMYNDPTNPKYLDSAADRKVSLTNRLQNETQPRFDEAKSDLDRISAKIQVVAARVQALSSLANGVSQVLQSLGNMMSENERADGAELTAEQQKSQSVMDEEAEFQRAGDDLLKSVRELLDEFFSSMNQINSSIYRNM